MLKTFHIKMLSKIIDTYIKKARFNNCQRIQFS